LVSPRTLLSWAARACSLMRHRQARRMWRRCSSVEWSWGEAAPTMLRAAEMAASR
jgi:hypothetical protein